MEVSDGANIITIAAVGFVILAAVGIPSLYFNLGRKEREDARLAAQKTNYEASSVMFRKNIERQVTENGKYRKALDQVIRSSPNSIAYRSDTSWGREEYDISLFVDDLISKKEDEAINTKTEDRDSRLAGLFNKKNGGTK